MNERFNTALDFLNLTQGELANLINVNIRTVRRWAADDCPLEIMELLIAWGKLKENGIHWKRRIEPF